MGRCGIDVVALFYFNVNGNATRLIRGSAPRATESAVASRNAYSIVRKDGPQLLRAIFFVGATGCLGPVRLAKEAALFLPLPVVDPARYPLPLLLLRPARAARDR